jgi:intraflagellar transport protein 81
MEEVSAEKGAVDSAKGATLNEMSAMVLQLNQRIADKKARLAPIIKGILLFAKTVSTVCFSKWDGRLIEIKLTRLWSWTELRPLRQEIQDLTIEYEEKKHSYDSMSAGLESTLAKLQQVSFEISWI